MREFVSVLQVTRESVSVTTTRALVWTCNEIEGSYDEIIITIVPSYTGNKNIYHSFVAVGIVTRAADGNKLVIFSNTALYYGDTYMCKEYRIARNTGGQ